MERGQLAKEYFLKGYNCSQAVVLAFSDLTGLEDGMAARMASSFGGGMGRLREVCGAFSGMMIVFGILYGYDASSPTEKEEKALHYARIQELARRFREANGALVCRELLENHTKTLKAAKEKDKEQIDAMLSDSPVPTERTEAYYQKRPCPDLCAVAADILDTYMRELKEEAIR
ncbi:MAG: C_GCAxxG_C_C family protein [Clostridia bacterium]|nr:C_GCAxxG_C_C family protein [Clostridia bacterium]